MSSSQLGKHCIEDCLIGTALDGMCVGLVLMNAAGRVSWLNRAAEWTLGLPRGDSNGKLLSQVLKDPNISAFWHAAREKDCTVLEEVAIQWPRQANLKANATPCYTVGGELIGRVLLFCDVTQEKALQVEISQDVASRLLGLAGSNAGFGAPAAGLTPAELRVLRLLGGGSSNDDIAAELGIAPSTVRSHLKHIYRKLDLHSRSEAVGYAVRNHLA